MLRLADLPRKFHGLKACLRAAFGIRTEGSAKFMSDRPATGAGNPETTAADLEAATRRLMAALEALESAAERRSEADRDEDELASRIQALGADRSRLADELDGALVRTRKLERANRDIAQRLDAAIGSIRSVLDVEDPS
jgi:DNA repair exonuclease SbcCD ATPase subunit